MYDNAPVILHSLMGRHPLHDVVTLPVAVVAAMTTATLPVSSVGAQALPPHPRGARTYTDAARWNGDYTKYGELAAHCGVTDASSLNPEDPAQSDCILDYMRQSGASPQAQQFFQEAHYFLADFRPLSPVVDVGHAFAPWSDMSRSQPIFLNGTPAVIWPGGDDHAAFTDMQGNSLYSSFFQQHPYSGPWETYATVESSLYGPAGGQRIVMRNPVRECRACDEIGSLLVTYTFDASGAMSGTDIGPLQTVVFNP